MISILLTISRIGDVTSECAAQRYDPNPLVPETNSPNPHVDSTIDEVILRRFPHGQRVAGKQVSSSEIHRNR